MIEMISIDNWIWLRSQLLHHYDNRNRGLDHPATTTFKRYVEEVFLQVLKWNQFNLVDNTNLDIIDNDDELALDLLEAVHVADNDKMMDSINVFDVSYSDILGFIFIAAYPVRTDGCDEQPIEDNQSSIVEFKQDKYLTVARLLNELRVSKSRQQCNL